MTQLRLKEAHRWPQIQYVCCSQITKVPAMFWRSHLFMGESSVNTSHFEASHFQAKASFQSSICSRCSDVTHKKALLLECTSPVWLPEIYHSNSLKEKVERRQASRRANSPSNLTILLWGQNTMCAKKMKGLWKLKNVLTESSEWRNRKASDNHTRWVVGSVPRQIRPNPSPSSATYQTMGWEQALCLLIIQTGDRMHRSSRIIRQLPWLSTNVTQNKFYSITF